eukprot:9480230-Pyramimonas_sp.AAC.2
MQGLTGREEQSVQPAVSSLGGRKPFAQALQDLKLVLSDSARPQSGGRVGLPQGTWASYNEGAPGHTNKYTQIKRFTIFSYIFWVFVFPPNSHIFHIFLGVDD